MPLVFPLSAMLRKLWGRPPGLRGTPSSRIWNKWGQRLAGCEQADGGVGRGPGGPPHDLCRRPAPEKRVALAWQAARDPEGTRAYGSNWRVGNPPDPEGTPASLPQMKGTFPHGHRPRLLLYPLGFLIAAKLMQDGGGGAAILAGLEADLRVHYFEEEVLFAFGEDFELRLIGELREHAGALARERQCDGRRELIDAGVAVEDLGVERDLRAQGWEFGERHRGIEQVHPDIVHTGAGVDDIGMHLLDSDRKSTR